MLKNYLTYIIQTDASNTASYTNDTELLMAMMEVKDKKQMHTLLMTAVLNKYPSTNLEKMQRYFFPTDIE